jgi:hypothetical protein
VLLRLKEKQQRSGLPRRMPCEKYSQVVGTLIPQESRTLHSNQLAAGGISQKSPQKQQSFRKEPFSYAFW